MLLLTPYCSMLLLLFFIIFYSPSLSLSSQISHSLLSLKFLSIALSLLATSLLQNPTHISLSNFRRWFDLWLAFLFLFLFPVVISDAVMGLGLGLRFGCDFGGWGLRLWAVVTVTLVVVAMVVVEWVLWLVGCGLWWLVFFSFFSFFDGSGY